MTWQEDRDFPDEGGGGVWSWNIVFEIPEDSQPGHDTIREQTGEDA